MRYIKNEYSARLCILIYEFILNGNMSSFLNMRKLATRDTRPQKGCNLVVVTLLWRIKFGTGLLAMLHVCADFTSCHKLNAFLRTSSYSINIINIQ